MLKRAVFERSRRELSLDVSVGVHILLVVEQSRLESQSRGCAKTPYLRYTSTHTHTYTPQQERRTMGRTRAQGREAMGGIGGGAEGTKKCKKPPNVYRGEIESGGGLGGRV